jgi:hypothetical protein
MREESHHHLVLANEYVNVFFVEIPAHETTLLHHHDLPYVSVPPGGADANPIPVGELAVNRGPDKAHVAFAAGNFSHAVTNSSDVSLRNVAVELVRAQGTIRNRCFMIVPTKIPTYCMDHTPLGLPVIAPLFETDEVLVQSWDLDADATAPQFDQHLDMLVAGLNGVSITSSSGIDSANAVRGGILWIPANSHIVIKTAPDRGGHFIAITFKDSAPASR